MGQQIPTPNNEVARVRTTYEKVVAHMTTPPFAYVAKQDGTVTDINPELGFVKITYADGTRVAIEYGNKFSSYSSSSLYIQQSILTRLKAVGETFKTGDVLCYNGDFFAEDPFSTQVSWKFGKRVNVAIMASDSTHEDANAISKELADTFVFSPVHTKVLVLSKQNVIHKFASIGTMLKSTDVIMVFEEDDSMIEAELATQDAAILESFMELNRKMPKADSAGVVVKIDVLYTSPLASMHPTMQKFVKYADNLNQQVAKYTADVQNSVPPNKPILTAKKLGITELTPDTVVVKYYIQDSYPGRAADKYVFGPSLKSVTSFIDPNPIYTEDGSIKLLAKFSSVSIANRIVTSARLVGTASLVLKALQDKAVALLSDD